MESVVILVILAMVAINAVFAAYEIALASVSVARLQILVRENRRGAKVALGMKQNMEASLATVQVGITLVGAIAAATGGAGAKEDLQPFFQQQFQISETTAGIIAIALIVVPLTAVTILFGELVPKVFAIRNKEAVCLWLAGPMRVIASGLWPVVWVFENGAMSIIHWIERRFRRRHPLKKSDDSELQELRAHATHARASRLIGEREEGIILNASRLSGRPVREIMLPAEDISMLDVNSSLADSLISAHLDMHTRFPVTEKTGDPQRIIGYVNFKDIVALMRLSHPHKLSLRNVVRAMPTLDANQPIASCMERMIHEHSHIALVRHAGAVVGMITLEDILEELVGDIEDEYDRLPAHAVPSGRAWVVGGGITLGRLKDMTAYDLAAVPTPSGTPRTLNEWIVGQLGDDVQGGEILERGGYRILVRKIRRRKALEVQISRPAETDDE